MITNETLRSDVFSALNQAKENGYDFSKGHPELSHMPMEHQIEQIAIDILDVSAEFEGWITAGGEFKTIVPYVKEWMEAQA